MLPRIITRGDHEAARLLAREGIRQLNILKGLMNFGNLKQDIRRVRFTNGSEIVCRSIFGMDDIQIYVPERIVEKKLLITHYIYVTISDYVTIWCLETGEVAEDIVDTDGKPITFPCHKDELITWLKGIEDRPTREVLKDNPINCRDYLEDNHKDIGDENRLEYADSIREDYICYYGIRAPVDYTSTNNVQSGSTCDPFSAEIHDDPFDDDVVNCNPDKCKQSFRCLSECDHYYDCEYVGCNPTYDMSCPADTYFCNRDLHHGNEMEYLQVYFNRSKHLYLGSYPCDVYYDFNSDTWIEYTTPSSSKYKSPINIEFDNTHYNCGCSIDYPEFWSLRVTEKKGSAISITTPLGPIIIDDAPVKERGKDYKPLKDVMKEPVLDDECFSKNIVPGSPREEHVWEARLPLWRDYWHPPTITDGPEHATEDLCWAIANHRNGSTMSESNRTAISWCGSPKPLEETKGWYRILLFFHTGCFHVGGCEWHQNYNDSPYYYPSQSRCEEAKNAGYTCEISCWEDKTISKRFSVAQAIVELENPEKYPKENDPSKYKRPDDFDVNLEKFSSLCAFPGRTCKNLRGPENGKCYPFDGTYEIISLEKAIEELINKYYKDGSNDKLLVYLLKKPIIRRVP